MAVTTDTVISGISEENSEAPVSVPASSAPTEYGQSYTYYAANGSRPRNPVSGWQTRNVSNILPSGPEVDPARLSQRRAAHHQDWPWLARQTATQIFPGKQATTSISTDFNNNVGGNVVANGRRHIWPWQVRARESGIVLSDGSQPVPASNRANNSTSSASRPEHRTRWPWQDRAMKSVIFENDVAPKPLRHRNYQWDQRQSSSVEAAVHQNYQTTDKNDKKTKKPAWPWEERAHQSVVFRSPDKVKLPRQVKYVWDQRKTRLSVKLDPKAKFPEGSLYTDSFVKWKSGEGTVPPAGKPCYNDDDDNDANPNVNACRKKYIRNKGSSISFKLKQAPSIALLSPPLKNCSSSSSVKGTSCLELVPMGYQFPASGH